MTVVVSTLLVSCGKRVFLTGYIPADAKPAYVWHGSNNDYDYDATIMVVSDKGDTISVDFFNAAFFGGYLVRFKDSYPPAVGKNVYVSMYLQDSVYYIIEASLKPYPVEK